MGGWWLLLDECSGNCVLKDSMAKADRRGGWWPCGFWHRRWHITRLWDMAPRCGGQSSRRKKTAGKTRAPNRATVWHELVETE